MHSSHKYRKVPKQLLLLLSIPVRREIYHVQLYWTYSPHLWAPIWSGDTGPLWWQWGTPINRLHSENETVTAGLFIVLNTQVFCMFSVLLRQDLLWNLWSVKPIKDAVKTGVALKKLRFSERFWWWFTDSWPHYPQHFTHDGLRGDFKRSHTWKSPLALLLWHNENVLSWNTVWHLALLCSCHITLN